MLGLSSIPFQTDYRFREMFLTLISIAEILLPKGDRKKNEQSKVTHSGTILFVASILKLGIPGIPRTLFLLHLKHEFKTRHFFTKKKSLEKKDHQKIGTLIHCQPDHHREA